MEFWNGYKFLVYAPVNRKFYQLSEISLPLRRTVPKKKKKKNCSSLGFSCLHIV
jgi:hypothetical protein